MKLPACTPSAVIFLLALHLIHPGPPASSDSFDAEFARLKKGRRYTAAKTGEISYRFAPFEGGDFETIIEIPESYDPARKWPVRVQLHGGVARPFGQRRQRRPNGIAGSMPQIYVSPYAWNEAQWWQANQVDNIRNVLDKLKREYNVDESRIYITGFSDGGTGAFFFGMRDPTMFSAIMPLHGNMAVLGNPSIAVDGQMYPGNLVNRPMFATNGGNDPLYPASRMAPMMEMLQRAGVPMLYRPLPNAGHEMSWWPAERDGFERFIAEHPRQAHPARLSWETERTDRYNRVDWLVITALGRTPSDQALRDVNDGLFGRNRSSGRVDVTRTGNTFDAQTRGVKTFTLLLSPDAVEFAKPVKVVVNGRIAFDGTLAKDPAVLLKWAARDTDREVLYGAELTVEVK
jgi:poly(3-hydroxybutyrate) depolymerase